ncbi:MAG: SGNH/GDSL hydrolase family protein, partial [Rhodospirillales bacterium]
GMFKVNTTFDLSIVQVDRSRINFSVRSNNIGLLSENKYAFERDPRKPEYRIVVLGDSFTAATTATYMWVDTVERLLNDSGALRAAVGNKTFRVYNLGIIGAGFARFWDAFDKSGRHFSPDLVIVNYLNLDLPRGRRVHLRTEEEMLAEARRHVDKLAAETKGNLLLTLMPSFEELTGKAKSDPGGKLGEIDARFTAVALRARMPAGAGEKEIESWFNYPFDLHYSDRGGEIYARAMAAVIAERVVGLTIDFSRAPSPHGDEVLFRPGAPMTRPIRNSLSRLADDGDAVVNLRRNIYLKEQGKAFARYPVGLAAAFGLGGDGLSIDLTKPRTQAFQQVRF